ncbi:Ig-like domain-containing protein [Mucilaginibacter roseus]|uniref:Ig-like domain-containing protein n=1 Tax=Mucilaginibacter roseus TaxID=1528868 RepID=A0ABS8U1G5_9SPHI|nr:Ig-like domain-containing protein [Mucilaginibacter roseus]MCD8739381.1 Ig-like domain-containing protein [Mucilaginibacter roseus]
MKKTYLLALTVFLPLIINAQQFSNTLVYTADIDHFWQAYDSVAKTIDTSKHREIIQKLYVNKGTPGLHAFMRARNYDADLWAQLIRKYPKFWQSIRPNTLRVKKEVAVINKSITDFKQLYPDMRTAKMYFTIGGLRSGGTTTGDMVLVGSEIASADQYTDASELSDWLKNVFANQKSNNLVALNIHEYVHTQQNPEGGLLLLAQSIKEGSADFIAELVTNQKNNNAYMLYGRTHELELKSKFKIEMFTNSMSNWLYNGSGSAHPDLGYFMGYRICRSYYQHQVNKRQAIKTMIELNWADEKQITSFLDQSKYYPSPVNKQALIDTFEKMRPFVTGLSPAINGVNDVSSSLSELTINFSEPMAEGYSISFGEGGKEHFPLSDVTGFSADRKSFKLKMALQPGKTYEFIVTDRSFKSQTGYPLKNYTVSFAVK